jgi:hypothetical protein
MKTENRYWWWAAGILSNGLGALLVFAALGKIFGFADLVSQLHRTIPHFPTNRLGIVFAAAFLACELAVGLANVGTHRPAKIASMACAFLYGLFLGYHILVAIRFGWAMPPKAGCGCFGGIEEDDSNPEWMYVLRAALFLIAAGFAFFHCEDANVQSPSGNRQKQPA